MRDSAGEKEKSDSLGSATRAELATVLGAVSQVAVSSVRNLVQALESFEDEASALQQSSERVAKASQQLTAPLDETLDAIARPDELTAHCRQLVQEMREAASSLRLLAADARHACGLGSASEQPRVLLCNELLDRTLDLFARELHGVHVQRDYTADLPPLVIERGQVLQMFSALLTNCLMAIRAEAIEEPRLGLETRSESGMVAISFVDNGVGMPHEDIAHVFDPLRRIRRPQVGLRIARSIARGLGGDLMVESVHGVGASLLVVLPASGGLSGAP